MPDNDQAADKRTTRRRFTQMAGLGGLGFAAAAAGCGSSSNKATAQASTGGHPSGGVDPSKQKYYLVSGNISDPYYNEVRAGFEAADKAFGFAGTKVTGTQNTDISQIVNMIMALIAKSDTSGLMLPNLDPKAYGSVFKAAAEKKLPIVNYLNDFVSPRISFIGASESVEAQQGAATLGQELGGKGKVVYIAQLIQPDLVAKGKTFAQALQQKFPGITYLGAETYDGSPEDGLKTFNAVHSKNGDLAGVYWGDGSGGAVAQSIHSAAPDVKLLLTDVVGPSLDAVKKAHAFAAFGPSVFDISFYAPQLLYWWNSGYRVPDPVLVPLVTVDTAGVAAFQASPHTHGGDITGKANPSIA